MKSALNFKNGLISLQQAGRCSRKPIQSAQDWQESLVVSAVLRHTCDYWCSALEFYEATEVKLQLKRNEFVLRGGACRAEKVGSTCRASRKAAC